MRPLTTLPTPLLALLSTFALPHVYAQDELKIDVTEKVSCSRPTKDGDEIAVHYRGSLQSNGVVFDESYKRGEPIKFILGAHKVIDGWDKGLLDMCPGERRTLTIPPDMAYGHWGRPPVIPGEATLIFETELVDIVGVEQEKIEFAPSTTTSSSASVPVETATSTIEQTFSIATAPSEPPATKPEEMNEDGMERPQPGLESSEDKTPPPPAADVNENPALPTEQSQNDELISKPVTPPQSSSDSPMTAATEEGECHLLGPFALIVQGALGAVALLSLVYKRWRETPKRPWKIFFFDVSKQVLGSFLTHVLNLAMSMLGSVDMVNSAKKAAIAAVSGDAAGTNAGDSQEMPNPCSFYLLNLGIDTTLGIPVLYLLLRILYVAFSFTPLARPRESIKSGHYGYPPRATWWLKQLLIYFIGLTGMKMFVWFLFAVLPWLPWVGDWALRWTEGSEALQVAFALFIFPLAMNAVQYWVIDSFIMERKAKDGNVAYERVQGGDGDGDDDDLDALASMLGSDEDEEEHVKNGEGFSPPVKGADMSVHSGQSSRGISPGESHEVEFESQETRKRR